MPMDAREIESMIKAAIPDATVEIRDLANGSGGAFFGIDNTQATQWIVERIDRSEATRLESEATLVRFSEPTVWLAVAVLAAAGLVVLAWRAKA